MKCNIFANFTVLCLSLTLVGNTSVAAEGEDQWPQWLKDGMSQESKGLKPEPVSIDDPVMTMSLPGPLNSKAEHYDGVWYLPININSPSILECYVHYVDTDPANLVASLADYNMELTADVYGKLGNKELYDLEVGHFDGRPFMSLEWLYTMGEGSKKVAGLVKSRVAVIENLTLVCVHNVIGYRETFKQSFERIARSLRTESKIERPFYQELYTMKINEHVVGYNLERFTLDGDGDTENRTLTSMLIPRSKSDLATSDTSSLAYSRPDGSLINRHHFNAQDGELIMGLSLEKDDTDQWIVSGEFSGKQFQQKLDYEGDLVSRYGQYKAVRDLALSNKKNITLNAWIPGADPGKILPMKIVLMEKSVETQAMSYTIGPMKMSGNLDKAGTLTDARVVVGPQEIYTERVWSSGEF